MVIKQFKYKNIITFKNINSTISTSLLYKTILLHHFTFVLIRNNY